MRISRHIHYFEGATTCLRHEFNFDPPFELPSTLGKVNPMYPEIDFTQPGRKATVRKVSAIVNTNGLLHLHEVMQSGEVLSVAIRPRQRLESLVIGEGHTLELLADHTSLVYWILIGNSGAIAVSARSIPDKDKFLQTLKEDLKDPAMREYLVKHTISRVGSVSDPLLQIPAVMTHEEAAKYLRIAPGTLYNLTEVPRLKHNKYRKEDLDRYLQLKSKRKGQ